MAARLGYFIAPGAGVAKIRIVCITGSGRTIGPWMPLRERKRIVLARRYSRRVCACWSTGSRPTLMTKTSRKSRPWPGSRSSGISRTSRRRSSGRRCRVKTDSDGAGRLQERPALSNLPGLI